METTEKANPNDEHPQLAWSQEIPDYGNKLLKRLDEFRKTTILYDVCVRAQGSEFNAHKVILAACGGIFRTCFVDEKKKMISSDCTELNLDCPAQGLKPIIRFAYTGGLVVTKRNAVATMIAAEETRMREVQEICAGIAIKEYGWLVNFSGEKDETVVENLGKVLNLHAACFVKTSTNGSHVEGDSDLPFEVEVCKKFPEQTDTYHMLAIKLKCAEDLASKVKTNEGLAAKSAAEDAKLNENDFARKAKSSSDSSDSSGHDSVDGKEGNAPANPEKQHSALPSNANVKTETAPDEDNGVIHTAPKKTPNKELPPPSPQVKPRASVKAKKSAPLPPSLNPVAEKSPAGKPQVEKLARGPAPRRPTKQPAKVPPPRPKPPVKKKTLSEQGTPTLKEEIADDYDDSLNPFA